MGKKKTRQNSNCIVAPDPSESSDAAAVAIKPGSKIVCPHLNKSVDTNALRKNFRGNGHLANRECFECKKQNITTIAEDVWLCLRCGACCCGPEKNNHALNHFETPRSDSHGLVIKLETLVIWCHECRLEIPAECSQKLYSCVDFIKQQKDRLTLSASSKKSSSGSVVNGIAINGSEKNNFLTTANKLSSAVGSGSKVKGLTNLGNTCFFNSVLQCLAQTPGLVNVLREMLVPGKKFMLPLCGTEPLSGELDKGGPVSESLLELLIDMSKSDDTSGVLVPRKLLAALRRKCPVFEGGGQHDAHELLRHLLDVVRTEDLRRYQRVILQISGLSTKVNPVDVAEDKKKWVKEVNQKVSEEMPICPDQVFKGMLVSQLQCQTCFHTSDCLESFLDLSLPVTSEKPVPPVVTRRKNQLACKSEPSEYEVVNGQPQQSSCMSKKERRQMQKRARNKKKSQLKEEGQGEPSITEEDKKESSDADIEDNDEIGLEDRKIDILESGYSSEKPASSRTSPVTECRGEAEDSACASPSSASDTVMITNGVANLQLEDHCMQSEEKQCLLSRRSESGLGSSIVSVQESNLSAFGTSELSHCIDSSDSIKGNPSSTSRDLSTESLPKIGSLSQDDSVSSDHDDTLTVRTCGTLTEGSFIDAPSAGKDDLLDDSIRNNESKRAPGNCRNEAFYVNSELSCINSRNDCCSPFEYNKQIARSSPVENSGYQSLDSNLLSMSLESYKTEFLLSTQSQGEDNVADTNLSVSSTADVLNETYDVNKDIFVSPEVSEGDLNPNKSNCQEMGFVLVGGVSRSNDNIEHSVSFSKNKAEIVPSASGDSKPMNGAVSSGNDNDPDLSEEISADFYKNRHITLAPRYECPEGECSVLSCLNHFTAIEMMAGNNKVSCEACTQRQSKGCSKDKEPKTVYRVSTKRLLISSPPPVLILHLKRFQVQRFSFRKLNCHVGFPAVLDLAPFCSASVQKQLPPNQTQILYSLYGVVAHGGTLRCGHYVAYVKVRSGKPEEGKPHSGTWYYISDSHAREVSEDNVLNSQAYLLFYERFL